jgi:SARP family transcriptional regulator, regulator of embCAB operon
MLRIYLTGPLCLASGPLLIREERLPGRQGRLAFAYLVSERGRPVSRDELAEVLWPGSQPMAWEVALSALVSKLRALLAEAGLGREVIARPSGCYHLELPAGSWVDTEAALLSVHEAEGALRSGQPQRAHGAAAVAAAIVRRPFLPGLDGAWIDARRAVLQATRLRALDCLAEVQAWCGDHALALRSAEEAVALEPYRESGYQRLMRVHLAAGNRAEALRVYERCRRLLSAELGTRPTAETEAVLGEGATPS